MKCSMCKSPNAKAWLNRKYVCSKCYKLFKISNHNRWLMKHKWYVKPIVKIWNELIVHKYNNGISDLIKHYHFDFEELKELSTGIKTIGLDDG